MFNISWMCTTIYNFYPLFSFNINNRWLLRILSLLSPFLNNYLNRVYIPSFTENETWNIYASAGRTQNYYIPLFLVSANSDRWQKIAESPLNISLPHLKSPSKIAIAFWRAFRCTQVGRTGIGGRVTLQASTTIRQ